MRCLSCESFSDEFTPKTKSMLVDRHQNYRAKGDENRYVALDSFLRNRTHFTS